MLPIRTFVAVDVSSNVNTSLAGFIAEMQNVVDGVQWITPENFHLTLSFLGDIDPTCVTEICQVIAEEADQCEPFALSFEGVGAFPDASRPRVVWTGVREGKEAICALQDAIAMRLGEIGYPAEARRYQPHITLGRVKRGADTTQLGEEIARFVDRNFGESRIEEVLTMSSQLGRGGPTYAIMGRARLA